MDGTSLVAAVIRVSERVASLEPLYELPRDNRTPILQIKDALSVFPNRGRVVWFDPPRTLQERTVWLVDVVESLTFRESVQNADRYMVAPSSSPSVLSDVFDLRTLGDEEAIRCQATEEGLLLTSAPTGSAFLHVGPRRFIGPVDFERVDAGGRWRVRDIEKPLSCWEGSEADVLPVGLHSSRRDVAVSRAWRRVGQTDWHPNDFKILTTVLKTAHKLDKELEPVQLTRKSLARLETILSGPLVSEAERELHQQRLRRVRSVLPRIEKAAELESEVIEAVLDLPAVRLAVDRHRETVEAAVQLEVTQRVTAGLSKERLELDRLRGDNTHAAQVLDAVRADVRQHQANLAELVGSFERTLAERVRAVIEDPTRFLADVVLLRAALGLRVDDSRGSAASISAAANSEAAPLVLSEPAQLVAALTVSFQAEELPSDLFRLLHGAFVAGAVPALTGGRAMDALRTYARCTTGARILHVATSSDILSPGDLLTAISTLEGGTRRLSDLLHGIDADGPPVLLVLENVNTCSVDTALLPLLRAQRVGEGPFPRNLWIAATLSEGPLRLPLGTSTWAHLALVDTVSVGDLPSLTFHPDRRISPFPPSAVNAALLQTMHRTASDCSVLRCAEVLEVLSASLVLDLGVRDQTLRLFAALCANGFVETSALTWAIAAAVLPSLPDQADALMAALKQQGLSIETVRAMQPAVRLVSAC